MNSANGFIIMRFFIALLIFCADIIPQVLSPVTKNGETTFSFRNNFSFQVNSVSVAGSFNNWDKSRNKMNFNSENNIWQVSIKLTPYVEYFYKLVINDTLWITDPNAPDVTEDEWRNGIITPFENENFIISNLFPPNNKRINTLKGFKVSIAPRRENFTPSDISFFINEKKIKSNYNQSNSVFNLFPPNNLPEGEHSLIIKENTTNNIIYKSKFYLDRYKARIKTNKFYDKAILYEIFVRKFHDSDKDGIGDLKGVIEKIPYLKSLGIDAIWLMPVNEGPTEHGYNVTDYYSIEKDYGSMNDFSELIKKFKKNGIKLIFDWVINHSDAEHPFFKDAKNNPASSYSLWYQFTDSLNSAWNHFGIEKNMPKFNFENKEVWKYFLQNLLWLMDPNKDGKFDDGIDGVRCDAAKEVPHAFWNFLRKEIKRINPDFLLLAEVWDGINYLIPFFEDEFDMCFDYPLYYAIENFFQKKDYKAIEKTLLQQKEVYPANFQMVRFLSNHDNHRSLSFFNNDTVKYFQALTLLFSLPGTQMIYYGDEIGLQGKTPPENVRQNMIWQDDNFANNKIFNFYKRLIRLRNENPALSSRFDSKNNNLKFIKTNYEELLCFIRKSGKSEYIVLINNSEKPLSGIKLLNTTLKLNTKSRIIFSKEHDSKEINITKSDINKLFLSERDFMIIKIR